MDFDSEVKVIQEQIRGKSLQELRITGIYCQVQEQGQERTWIEKLENLEKENKDIRDEVFVGHLPREVKAEELYDVFSKCGTIREIRLMFEFNNKNRGFCFIAFTNEREAQNAIDQLHDSTEIHRRFRMDGQKDKIGVNLSRKQKRLFLGGISKERTVNDIQLKVEEALQKNSEKGIVLEIIDVIKKSEWGYCFIDFKNHKQAALAKRTGLRELFGEPVTFDWAKDKSQDTKNLMCDEMLSLKLPRTNSVSSIPPYSGPPSPYRSSRLQDNALSPRQGSCGMFQQTPKEVESNNLFRWPDIASPMDTTHSHNHTSRFMEPSDIKHDVLLFEKQCNNLTMTETDYFRFQDQHLWNNEWLKIFHELSIRLNDHETCIRKLEDLREKLLTIKPDLKNIQLDGMDSWVPWANHY